MSEMRPLMSSDGNSVRSSQVRPDHHGHGHPMSVGGVMTAEGREQARKRLLATLIVTAAYMILELVGGLLTGSLALLADSAHMLSDVASLALSLVAMWLAGRPASGRLTYGFQRSEILAALINGSSLVAVSIYIFVEAFQRFSDPQPVMGLGMMGIAAGGLLVNMMGLWLLHDSREASLNVRGAWLHILADALGSLGALIAGALIWQLGWNLADPIVSVVIGLLVIQSSWVLLRDSVRVLMESVPSHLDVETVRAAMAAVPGVVEIHDLHIWSLSSKLDALTGHVVAAPEHRPEELLRRLQALLSEQFGLKHITLQVEPLEFEE